MKMIEMGTHVKFFFAWMMMARRKILLFGAMAAAVTMGAPLAGYGQAELQPWGNLRGIRLEGQLMPLGTSIRVEGKGGDWANATGKERQHPHFSRQGNTQIVETNLDSLYITERVEDQGQGVAKVDIVLHARAAIDIDGAWLSVDLPEGVKVARGDEKMVRLLDMAGHRQWRLRFVNRDTAGIRQIKTREGIPGKGSQVKPGDGGQGRGPGTGRLDLLIHRGGMPAGDSAHWQLMITVSGSIDRMPLHLALNTGAGGRSFEGFGGNFRLQNPAMDPQVIDYCLKNMRVAWARVEMPWAFWQPEKNGQPMDSARAGRLNPRVRASMEMAQRLSKMGIPLILSAWFPPRWAIVGEPAFRPRPGGVWGNPLNSDSITFIYKSIADYIEWLQKGYGTEIKLFSFNESDLGINIRQTGEEHVALIKGLGAYLQSRGLKTKMLLGDNSDATTWRFIEPAMADPAARPFIGAISFHSWRGWDDETLQKWAAAAQKMDLPLIVAEGSIDAAAWAYPAIFSESAYAMDEINLYIRLLAICQPLTILQWQLTSDYSPLVGGGLYGNQGPLTPTQRFWNLKQLSETPQGLKAMEITGDRSAVSCAAEGDNIRKIFCIHLVNNGAGREVILNGLPATVKSLRILVTDKVRGMKEESPVAVSRGSAHFFLSAWSYTKLVGK
ncbi:MAG TPA: hypothetical protein VNU72_12275 [Puia sp.]|nr:hypothetical protein [Puia sp.]